MGRRSFSKEFKLEAVRLVKERGVTVAQAVRDLDVHPNVLRNWVKELSADPIFQLGETAAEAFGQARAVATVLPFIEAGLAADMPAALLR